jgi:hypothetical protein
MAMAEEYQAYVEKLDPRFPYRIKDYDKPIDW